MSKKMILLIVSALLGLGLIIYGVYLLNYKHPSDYNEGKVVINGFSFDVDLADNMAKRAQGLSGREPLRRNEGMLFIFPTSSVQSFWMKDMKFPLDIIWINGETISGISENVPVPSEDQYIPPSYYSPGPVDKVLEVPAGSSAKQGFKAGDRIEFKLERPITTQE